MPNFLRRTSKMHLKLGKRKKKKQVWRRPTGRHNKMRDKRRGYPAVVSIGYKKEKNSRGKIKEKNPIIIRNLKDLEKIRKDEIAIIGKVGKKKKIEIIKSAKEKKIEIMNLNIEKFLRENEKKEEKNKKMTVEEAKKIIEKSKEKNSENSEDRK